jgi:hypothetical protein
LTLFSPVLRPTFPTHSPCHGSAAAGRRDRDCAAREAPAGRAPRRIELEPVLDIEPTTCPLRNESSFARHQLVRFFTARESATSFGSSGDQARRVRQRTNDGPVDEKAMLELEPAADSNLRPGDLGTGVALTPHAASTPCHAVLNLAPVLAVNHRQSAAAAVAAW